MATDPNYLLDAVDALTKPVRRKVIQDTEGGGTQTVTIILPCLLEQLEASIYGSVVNDGGGGSSAPQQRNVLDGDALFALVKMKSAIGDWSRMVGIRATKEAVDDLRQWYIAYNARPASDGREFYERELGKWARQIEARLDPVKRLEITEPCPVCGANEYTDEEGQVLKFPVVVEWRESAGQPLERAAGLCRACLTVWEGGHALRSLRFDLDVTPIETEAG
jgi:hypothetical protein